MFRPMSNPTSKKSRRGPKPGPPTVVVSLRLPEWLADDLQAYADQQGISRNQACIDLLEASMRPSPNVPLAHSYNPQTGEFEHEE
jgi:hypothetical protein